MIFLSEAGVKRTPSGSCVALNWTASHSTSCAGRLPIFDIVGDIHGKADALKALLRHFGYRERDGAFSHPDRRVIFMGDFIDRGAQIRETLEIVRRMVDAGSALAVMGNHELNFLAHHVPHPRHPGECLREDRKKKQLKNTLEQLSDADRIDSMEWFRTLPLWLDLDGLRVVHACWDADCIASLTGKVPGRIDDAFLAEACLAEGVFHWPVQITLKGKEVTLPGKAKYFDKRGKEREEMRVRWYESAGTHTYDSYALASEKIGCNQPLEEAVIQEARPYPPNDKPVFVGHYGLEGDRVSGLLAKNVACVDWVPPGDGLCGYRWEGEPELRLDRFVMVLGASRR